MPILVVVEDLIFLSKIRQTAKLVNAQIEVIQPNGVMERLSQGPASAVVCDLNFRQGLALDTIRRLKENPSLRSIPIVGFLSHVQADLATAARDAGCDIVMARSAFSKQLPQLLSQYAADDHAPAASPPA